MLTVCRSPMELPSSGANAQARSTHEGAAVADSAGPVDPVGSDALTQQHKQSLNFRTSQSEQTSEGIICEAHVSLPSSQNPPTWLLL